MAQVIKFYIPSRHKASSRWIPPEHKGKLIEFPAEQKKSA
jgi:hypothetical protein